MTAPELLRRLAVSCYVAPPGCSLERLCELLAHRGVGGIGLTAPAVMGRDPEGLARLLDLHELTCSSLNSAGYFVHADPRLAMHQAEVNQHLLECAAVLGTPVNVIPGGIDHATMKGAGRPFLAEVRGRAESALEQLADEAARAGVTLSLEPIHPLGLTDKGCVNQLSRARAIASRLPSVGLTIDLYHSWWDADLVETVAQAIDDLRIVQICGVETGWPGVPPRRTDMTRGVADVRGFLAELSTAGYSGQIEYEVMYQQRPQELLGLLDRAVADFPQLMPHVDHRHGAS